MLFGKRRGKVIEVDGQRIELQPKPGGLPLFGRKKPANAAAATVRQAAAVSKTDIQRAAEKEMAKKDFRKPTKFKLYVENLGAKHKGLEGALLEQGIKSSLYEFVRRMVIASMMLAAIMGVALVIMFYNIGLPAVSAVLLGGLVGVAIFFVGLQSFLNFPMQKGKKGAKLIDRDIIFASRDLIISLRSGMPLFNALTSISTGYGEASKEFGKVVQKVQLGTPLVDAIDEVIAVSKSTSFKRLMLQASVSIKSGADVVEALKSIIDELTEERSIDLKRYGQKLNAVAMFYMLFGIIFPSMGIAVLTIMTTFIAIFTVDVTTLEGVLVGIVFLQIVFLQLIRSSRPAFTM
jgi:flagellar protein FlaJ